MTDEKDLCLLLANVLRIDHPSQQDDRVTRLLDLRRVFAIFDENLCLLGNGEHPQYLQLEYLHMIVAVELIQSMLTNHHKSSARRMPPSAHVHTCCPHITVISKACRARVLLLLLYNTISPLLVQCSAFSLTLCGTCTIFLRTRVILAELATDAEVLLTLFIKLVSSKTRLVGPARVDESARNGDHAGMLSSFINNHTTSSVHHMRSGMLEAAVVRAR